MENHKEIIYKVYEIAGDMIDPIIEQTIRDSMIQSLVTDWGTIYFVWSPTQVFILDYVNHDGVNSVRQSYEGSGGFFADFYSDIAECGSMDEMLIKMKSMEF